MHPAWQRCESLKYLDIPAEDPVVFSGRFRALPGRRRNTWKCKFIFARTLKTNDHPVSDGRFSTDIHFLYGVIFLLVCQALIPLQDCFFFLNG
jgi:hypothetical protein